MSDRILVIGNKNYSSWSLRPWLLLKQAGIPFREIRIPLDQPQTRDAILQYSPTGRVPVLIEDGLTIWESLAICEWAAEQVPERALWPSDPTARAVARAVASEMHAGFAALRQHLPMDIRARCPGRSIPPEAQADIDRVIALWDACLTRWSGGYAFLFGPFGVADAMFAPVATRFRTYEVPLPAAAARYVETIFDMAPMREWCAAAAAETEVITYL